MSEQEMLNTVNKRINELIKAGAKKELMQKGLNDEEVKHQLYVAAVCTLIGA